MGLQIVGDVLMMIDGFVVAVTACELDNLYSWQGVGLGTMHMLVAYRLSWCKIWNGGFDHSGRSVGRSCSMNGYGRSPGNFGTVLNRGAYVVLQLLFWYGVLMIFRKSIGSYQLFPSRQRKEVEGFLFVVEAH